MALAVKKPAANAGDRRDVSSSPGSGRCSGEGTAHPLRDSWASLVAPSLKNPPAVRELWV